ncbi:hypothetical protein HPP92_007579 [Vanilla planifolia]|uniref:Pentatricopeptide repeat-containing protein n=1 Tax=Vanilla planifolia TaxID=51239 RepID=A0A835REE5_VANPL|nr:hypothetical protein HPP92_007579 [Vanilla planifolia]
MHNDHVYAAIMRGLCRSGLINYNILIDGSCKQGLKRKAYQIVGEMRKNGLKPDAVTWRILGRLHNKESTELVPSRNCIVESNGAEGVSTTSRELKLEEEVKFINKNDGELGDQVSLVKHSLSTKLALNGSFSQTKMVEQRQEEPLSRIARRVFGLL